MISLKSFQNINIWVLLIALNLLILVTSRYELLLSAFEEKAPVTYELRYSFPDDNIENNHHREFSQMDACNILPHCFEGSKIFGTKDKCRKTMKNLLKNSVSGYWVEKKTGQDDRIIGFMTIDHMVLPKNGKGQQYHALLLDNVCIDSERRRQGVAKKLISGLLEATIMHYKLEKFAQSTGKEIDPESGEIIPPLVLGLDVDLNSPTMPEAFCLYSKLGFVRWWTPCESVLKHDWSSLVDYQISPARNIKPGENMESKIMPCPLSQMLWDPMKYLKDAFILKSDNKSSLFCMYKFYSDSYYSLAKVISKYSQLTCIDINKSNK